MPDFFQFIGPGAETIETGQVIAASGGGRFTVRVKDTDAPAVSAVGSDLPVGSLVILNATAGGWFIVGVAGSMRVQQVREVVIGG
jgi:hypothetical protein